MNMVIYRDVIKITDTFWEDARKFFVKHPKELLPVADIEGNILGFCYNDDGLYNNVFRYLSTFGERYEYLPVSFEKYNKHCQVVCITDLNELAWKCWRLFRKMGYPVVVLGEKWEWFGIKSMEGYNNWPDYAKLYIYAEGTKHFRNEIACNKSRYEYVNENFATWLGEWAMKNMKAIYNMGIGRLVSEGVSVCIGQVPTSKEVTYYTELEKDNMLHLGNKKIRKKIIGERAEENFERGISIDTNGWRRVDYRRYYGESRTDAIYEKRIYLVGPCIVEGELTLAEDTLPALLQQLVKKEEYMVVRISSHMIYFMMDYDIMQIPIKKQDIIIFIESGYMWEGLGELSGLAKVDLKKLYNNTQRQTWLRDENPMHTNKHANFAIAQELYEQYLKKEIEKKREIQNGNEYIQRGEVLSEELQMQAANYVNQVRAIEAKDGTIGSIIMNCNPFTFGHRYLIEYAASKVDWLYIFVVEEDKSTFCFEDRLRLVRQGTSYMNNVIVVPSGNWVLSYQTMPIYFEKSQRKEERVDATMDLEIFARYIAPQLGISIRFVGEEPIDKVTRQYNEQMKKVLGGFGIKVEEIERKRCQGEVISASAVRKFVEEEKWDMVQKYVPETTYEYLKRKFC